MVSLAKGKNCFAGSEVPIQASPWHNSRCIQGLNFCLTIENGQPMLKRSYDYHRSVGNNQCLLLNCDFIVWTLPDMHVETIYIDKQLWQEMTEKRKQYYYSTLEPEINPTEYLKYDCKCITLYCHT